MISVEDNEYWYEQAQRYWAAHAEVNVDAHLVPVKSEEGQAYDGGHCWTEEEIVDYSDYPLRYGQNYADIVFIDSADRQDRVAIAQDVFDGWPVRNRCLQKGHQLLSAGGIVVVHDVPGPFRAMNASLARGIQSYRFVAPLEEFCTTLLSDTDSLEELLGILRARYRLGVVTRLASRLSNLHGRSWFERSALRKLMLRALQLPEVRPASQTQQGARFGFINSA